MKFLTFLISLALVIATAHADPLVFQGNEGIGKGKHIVFLAGDHESPVGTLHGSRAG